LQPTGSQRGYPWDGVVTVDFRPAEQMAAL
jgi:hypothetical protein